MSKKENTVCSCIFSLFVMLCEKQETKVFAALLKLYLVQQIKLMVCLQVDMK